MTDGDRPIPKGGRITDFVLLPNAGNFLHPAHRLGDQMIAVYLREGEWIAFSPMALVWVAGTKLTSKNILRFNNPKAARGSMRAVHSTGSPIAGIL
jgi:hypothetical protein